MGLVKRLGDVVVGGGTGCSDVDGVWDWDCRSLLLAVVFPYISCDRDDILVVYVTIGCRMWWWICGIRNGIMF